MLYNATVLSSYGSEVSQLFVSEPKALFAELQAWTSYTVQVSACVKRGSKLQCGTATTVVVRTSPTEPSMPTSVRTSTNGTAIHVTWDEPLRPNGPLMGYNVTWWLNNATQMSNDDPHKSTVFLEGAVRSYVIDQLHSAASYTIEVRRINGNNLTVFEGVPVRVEASTTPNSYPPPQGATYTIRRVNASHFEINLTWQAPRTSASADTEEYEVFIQRIEEGKPPVVFTANPLKPGYLFEVANMNPFIEYVVQIRAYARFGNAVVKGEAAEIRINVDAELLLIVFNVQVNVSADGVALVTWNSSLGADVQSSNTTMYVVNLVSTETGEEIEGTVMSRIVQQTSASSL
ncbi:hypothetical protein HPB50_001733 [Hyalomma asiaticum]|uniref:Uncharacterized protein n=1 Tax=Hyalomma asiaticum TaxID=266040 RepID=A0ACB7RMS4_HYAAI|nr:hypothetical protein HPB50_001733 [Hyalomma asiaticum]